MFAQFEISIKTLTNRHNLIGIKRIHAQSRNAIALIIGLYLAKIEENTEI